MREAVCVLLQDPQGAILSISRPHDREDVGLIGGSVEPEDAGAEVPPPLDAAAAAVLHRAAARELWEEAGIRLSAEQLVAVFVAQVGHTRVTTFVPAAGVVVPPPVLGQNPEGWVRWASAAEVCAGRYGAYNRALLAALAQREASPDRDTGQGSSS